MKNLFFVSVAIGIFSGTSLSAKAQPSVNMERLSESKSVKFINGIEINAGSTLAVPAKVETRSITAKPAVNKAEKETEAAAIEKCTSLQFKYALLLDMNVEAVTNKVLFDEIEKWLGTRYKYGGATEKGIDCSAYTGTLIHDIYGLVLPRTARDQYENCIKLEKEDMQQGDLVFFKTGRGVSHVGLYLGNGYFTHASSSIGVTISRLDESYWSSRFIGAGRVQVPKLEDEN